MAEGLPKSGALQTLQDSRGFLWVATDGGGLSRFDGREFVTYTKERAISGSRIVSLIEDPQGRLWMGSEDRGLVLYDGVHWKNLQLPSSVSGIRSLAVQPAETGAATETSYRIWVGTESNGLLCWQDGAWWMAAGLGNLQHSEISALLCDKQNRLWIGSDRGLALYDRDSLKEFGLSDGVLPRPVNCLLEDNAGQIWFGTEKGLLRYDGRSFYLVNKTDGLADSRVHTLCEDREGAIWIGTPAGLSRLSGDSLQTFDAANGLDDYRVRHLSLDREGNLWISTAFGGIARFRDPALVRYTRSDGLPSLVIPDLEARDGSLAVATWNGLLVATEGNRRILDTLDGLSEQRVERLSLDVNGTVWFSSSRPGLQIYQNGSVRSIALPEELQTVVIRDLQATGDVLWVLDENGVLHSRQDKGTEDAIWNTVSDGPTHGTVLGRGDGDDLWVGTASGQIWRYRAGAPSGWVHLPDPPFAEGVTALCHADESIFPSRTDLKKTTRLWAGAKGGAVAFWDGAVWKVFPEPPARYRQDIGNLVLDKEGMLWVSLDRGLLRMSLDATGLPLAQRDYSEGPGFAGTAVLPGSATLDNRGQLWLGTFRGLSCFRSELERSGTVPPAIQITGFKLLTRLSDYLEEDTTDQDTLLPWSGLPGNPKLAYRDNHVSFQFSGIWLSAPEAVRYRWKLEGFDRDWFEGGGRNFCSYSNLPPGNYRFVVEAGDDTGNWSPQAASFSFSIKQPFWLSLWFILIVSLFAIGLIAGIIRWRTAAIRRSHEKLDRQVREQTAHIQRQNNRLSEALHHAREAQEAAEHSEKAKERFLANMSHEIRTPMNAVVGLTRLLLERSPAPEQRNYLEAIRQSADNLLVIINDILDMAKIESGKMTFESALFSPQELLRNLDQMLGFKAREKGLTLHFSVANGVPDFLRGDPARLSQVLINLIGNAIKFTGEGRVETAVQVIGGAAEDRVRLRFAVRDTGIGIPPERQGAIFDSFTQAADSTTRLYGGTGLGLSISRQLVTMQGGEIGLESTPGKGSCFHFELDFDLPSPEELQKRRGTEVVGNGPTEPVQRDEALRILLMEDNPFNQMVAEETILSRLPHAQVVIAGNGQEGLDILKASLKEERPFDLILMDLGMPVLDGYAAAEALRADPDERLNRMPVIAMTASVTEAEIERCFRSGMDAYVPKPFDMDDLLDKILTFGKRKTDSKV